LSSNSETHSSSHAYGAAAYTAVERARAKVAALLGGEADGVVITASGSESDNLAIMGVAPRRVGERDHVVTSAVEHPPVIQGAGHERGLRAGTENVPYIAGLGAAATLAARRLRDGAHLEVQRLRDRLHAALQSAVPDLALNGHPRDRLPNTLNVSFHGLGGESLLARTPSIAAATGSACQSGRTEPSAVLTAMGLDAERALGAIRLSLGYGNTAAQIEAVATELAAEAAVAEVEVGSPIGRRDAVSLGIVACCRRVWGVRFVRSNLPGPRPEGGTAVISGADHAERERAMAAVGARRS
jgi:cysteine desulfurase